VTTSYDRNTPAWWDFLVDEHLLSRGNVATAHGRGCYDPSLVFPSSSGGL
jgi:hypothetical protein